MNSYHEEKSELSMKIEMSVCSVKITANFNLRMKGPIWNSTETKWRRLKRRKLINMRNMKDSVSTDQA